MYIKVHKSQTYMVILKDRIVDEQISRTLRAKQNWTYHYIYSACPNIKSVYKEILYNPMTAKCKLK